MNKNISIVILLGIFLIIFAFPIKIIKADQSQIKAAIQKIAVKQGNVFHMHITAYSSTPNQTDSTPFITANGDTVHDGVIASNIFPFGTHIQIPSLFGEKIFTVEDRMNKRIKNTLDIWMDDTQKALDFGVKSVNIIVLSTSSEMLAVK